MSMSATSAMSAMSATWRWTRWYRYSEQTAAGTTTERIVRGFAPVAVCGPSARAMQPDRPHGDGGNARSKGMDADVRSNISTREI